MQAKLITFIVLMGAITIVMVIDEWRRDRRQRESQKEAELQSKYFGRLSEEERYQRWLETPKAGNAHAYGVRKNEEE